MFPIAGQTQVSVSVTSDTRRSIYRSHTHIDNMVSQLWISDGWTLPFLAFTVSQSSTTSLNCEVINRPSLFCFSHWSILYHGLTSLGPWEESWEESRGLLHWTSAGVVVVGDKFLQCPLKKQKTKPLILASHLNMLNQYGLLISTQYPALDIYRIDH